MKPNFYKQTDSRWASKRYRTTDGGYPSVGGAGCGPSTIANIVSATTHPSITPKDVFKYACKHGYMTANQGMYWSAVPKILKHYGVTAVETLTHTSSNKLKLKKYLEKGYWAQAIMHAGRWTRGGHYILPYKVDGNYVHISDPASYAENRAKASFDTFWAQNDCDWAIIDPSRYACKKPKKADPKTVSLYVSADYVNVRVQRSEKSDKKCSIAYGKKVKLCSYKDGWYKVYSGAGKGGFVHESNFSKYKQEKATYTLLEDMNLRTGYSTKSEIISVIKAGTRLTSTKRRGRWCFFKAQKGTKNKAGFIARTSTDGKQTYMKKGK